MSLIQEKADQAVEVLKEQNIDLWLTFVRETSGVRDPALDLLIGAGNLTWPSALILTRSGEKIAIVGNLEKEAIRRLEVFSEIHGYDTSLRELLRDVIARLKPGQIAVNTSRNNVHADGLTHAMYEFLNGYLADTPSRTGSSALNRSSIPCAVGNSAEQARIRSAVEITEEIFQKTFAFIKVGMTEIQIADYMHGLMKEYGVDFAWPRENNPAVNSGPDSSVGHNGPTGIKVERGHIIHFDFGVKFEDYCSDIQRVVYVLREGETAAPKEVQRGFAVIRSAVEEARAAMKAGVTGNSIDVIARGIVTDSNYPEYNYALGHQLGRVAHDGGALLGSTLGEVWRFPESKT